MLKTKSTHLYLAILLSSITILSGCITSKKMDLHVAEQYSNKLPGENKKKNTAISVTSAIPFTPANSISITKKKTRQLPLIVYWHYDYRHTTTLNPAIAVSSFSNTVNQQSAKLNPKLNGRQLELTVEQVPNNFAIVDKGNIILFFIHWHKVYVETDVKDLVVSYKVLENGIAQKTGKITVQNEADKNRGIRFAQSWKSSSAEYLLDYNANVINMSKSFVTKLLQEL